MKFFMPGKSAEDAENIYQGFQESVPYASEKRIYSLTFWDGELHKTVTAAVGKPAPGDGRIIMGILEANDRYLMWVKERGEDRMIVGKDEVRSVEEFEP
jgi:hypothetical protein